MYPGKEKKIENLLSYLVKQRRLHLYDGYYYIQPPDDEPLNRGLLASVWVLIDFIDRVEFHSSGDYPAQVIFFADGEIYEIIHVAPGKETLINHLLSKPCEEPSMFLILVDNCDQISKLNIPNVAAYCTVSTDGDVTYYQKN